MEQVRLLQHRNNVDDLFMLKQLKQLKDAQELLMLRDPPSKDKSKSGYEKEAMVEEEEPKKLRFPAPPAKDSKENVVCRWDECGLELESPGKLIDHMRVRNKYIF